MEEEECNTRTKPMALTLCLYYFLSLPSDHSFCFNKGGHGALLRRGQGLFPGRLRVFSCTISSSPPLVFTRKSCELGRVG